MDLSQFITERIQETTEQLSDTNGIYSLALEKRKDCYELINPILSSKKDVLICTGDIESFNEFFRQDLTATALEQQNLYKQGYWDCVELLKTLGVI